MYHRVQAHALAERENIPATYVVETQVRDCWCAVWLWEIEAELQG